MTPNDLIDALKAAGEPTRLRVLHLLAQAELSVGELVQILGQSQPSLSRHLKHLTQAGLVDRLPEGAWVYYRVSMTEPGRGLCKAILERIDGEDEVLRKDLTRLEEVQTIRRAQAEAYFSAVAEDWDRIRALQYPEADVEAAILDAAGPGPFSFLVDIGTGTGRMLSLFAERTKAAEGLDFSRKMLAIARANLARDEVTNAAVRQGDATTLPYKTGVADLVLVHQVLHYLDRPREVIAEAARILAPGGRLLVVDFAPHAHEFLRRDHAHRHLGLGHDQMSDWASLSGLTCHDPIRFDPPKADGLAVHIWVLDKLSRIGEQAA